MRIGLFDKVKTLPLWHAIGSRALAWLVAGFVFVVYLRTMAPTVLVLDSAELTIGAMTLGLIHPPGYSVYLLLAHLCTYLPVGDVAYRVNLLSALASAGTVLILVLLLQEMTRRVVPTLVASLSFAFSFYVWSLSIVAEVYTLQAFFLAILLFALWRWQQRGSWHALLVAAYIMGLAAANSPATILWWPGLLFLACMSRHRQQLSWHNALKLIGVLALGLLPIFYLPIRSITQLDFNFVGQYDGKGVFHPIDLTQFDNFLWYISGRLFSWMVFAYSPSEFFSETVRFLHRLLAAFLGVGLPLGVWGIWVQSQRQRVLAIGLLLTALPHAIFFIGYQAQDKDTMFLPVYLIWAIFLGLGVNNLIEMLPKGSLRTVPLLLPLSLLLINLPYANVAHVDGRREMAITRLQAAEQDAIYLAQWADGFAMKYMQINSELRSDINVINIFFTTSEARQALVEHALDNELNVYLTYSDPLLLDEYKLIPIDYGFQLVNKNTLP